MPNDHADVPDTPGNPLLQQEGMPRFDRIRPEHVESALADILSENRKRIAVLEHRSGPVTWANFVQVLEDLNERLARMWSPVSHLNAVKDSPELRKAHENALPRLTDYYTDLSHNENLFRKFGTVRDSDEFDRLDRAQRKIIGNALRDYRLAGVNLPRNKKPRFKSIQQELASLSNRFERNVLDSTESWSLQVNEQSRLTGLPDTVLELARQAAETQQQNGWRFTLHTPSYLSFMMYCRDRELRKRMYSAYVTRASEQGPDAGVFDNSGAIERLLALRHESATLLGFDGYASVSLETKMAGSPARVEGFLLDLAGWVRTTAEHERAELEAFARDECDLQPLQVWDLAYVSERLRQSRYVFSDEDMRPYFPFKRVIEGLFTVARRLYGIEARRVDGVEVWHPDVEFYELLDGRGEVRGRFFLDPYVRNGKRDGAWMDDCIPRKRTDGRVQVPVAYLVCNLSPPVGDRPALLTHEEVLTLFHEFGHGLHHLLSKVDYVSVSGINGVQWDAVELPSQFMENWCWEAESLNLISGHYRTGEPLPAELLDKMRLARNFQSAMQMLRQIEFSLFDLRLHRDYVNQGIAYVYKILHQVRTEVAVVMPPGYNRFPHSFSHIFAGGYAAGYYSYKWAELLSADAFSRFEEEGVLNPATGRSFLENILEVGGVEDAGDMFRNFRGRDPTVDALLRHNGLAG
ncbi:MAG: Oligopeptidase A [Gammaproteobacteria bacterium]|nr:Oligopeptidase A [Gammaproteobacteria bacterium]